MQVPMQSIQQNGGLPGIVSKLQHGGLAQVLPQIIDKLTPAGQIPDNHGGLLSQAISALQKTGSNEKTGARYNNRLGGA